MKKFWLSLILFLLLPIYLPISQTQATPEPISPQPEQVQESEKAPYIQYFSPALQGIVVERADGTDSRVIGKGLVPASHDQVRGGGWSPSGKWFAWISWRYVGEGSSSHRGHIVKADNSRILRILDGLDSVSSIIWSPTDDIILVTNNIEDAYPAPKGSSTYIIDVETEQVLNSYSTGIEDQGEENFYTSGNWSPDGQYVLAYGNLLTLDGKKLDLSNVYDVHNGYAEWALDGRLMIVDNFRQTLTLHNLHTDHKNVFSFDKNIGEIWQHPNQQEILINIDGTLSHVDLATSEVTSTHFEYIYERSLNNNRAIFRTSNGRVLYDFTTHQETPISTHMFGYEWSSSGRYLLYWHQNSTDDNYQMWVFDTKTNLRYFLGFSPQRFPTYCGYYGLDCTQYFSPDASYIFLAGIDGVYIWDTQSHVSYDTGITGIYALPIRWLDNHSISLHNSVSRQISEILVYNVATQSARLLGEQTDDWNSSPNREYLIFRGLCPNGDNAEVILEPLCIHNFASNSFTALTPHNLYRGHAIYNFWHPTQNWIHVGYEFGPGLHIHSVHNADGGVSRGLPSECGSQDMCFSWLPERIDVEAVMQPPRDLLTEPVVRLQNSGYITALTYNDDGTQLAAAFTTYTFDKGVSNRIQIWDLETHAPLYIIPTPYEYVGGLAWVNNNENFVIVSKEISPEQQGNIVEQDADVLDRMESVVTLRDSQSGQILNTFPQDGAIWIWDLQYIGRDPIDTEVMISTYFSQHPFVNYERTRDSWFHGDVWGVSLLDNRVQKYTGWPYLTPNPNERSIIYIDSESTPFTLNSINLGNGTDNFLRRIENPPAYQRSYISEFLQHGTISSNGQWYALTGHTFNDYSQTLVWDLETGEFYTNYPATGLALEFSPDSEQIAIGTRNEVLIWDVQPSPLLLDKIDPDPFSALINRSN